MALETTRNGTCGDENSYLETIWRQHHVYILERIVHKFQHRGAITTSGYVMQFPSEFLGRGHDLRTGVKPNLQAPSK